MSSRHFIVATVALVGWNAVVCAQTLGDVARQEEARRKETKPAGKVYTNESLHPEPNSTPPPAAASTPATDPASTEPSAPTPSTSPAQSSDAAKPADANTKKDGAKSADSDTKKDEKYWKTRLADARSALDRATTFAEALQSRINALTADFTARADPAQRAQIANDRQKALTELERVQKEIKDNTKAIADLQDEARKANVPAGWVR